MEFKNKLLISQAVKNKVIANVDLSRFLMVCLDAQWGTSNAGLWVGLNVVYCSNHEAPISSFTMGVVFCRSFETPQKSHGWTKQALSLDCRSSKVDDLLTLKSFSISSKTNKTTFIIRVEWLPPPCFWIKSNTDGATRSFPGLAPCGVFFTIIGQQWLVDSLFTSATILLCMLNYLVQCKPLKLLVQEGWHKFWLECDSQLVIVASNSFNVVPWHMRNRHVIVCCVLKE